MNKSDRMMPDNTDSEKLPAGLQQAIQAAANVTVDDETVMRIEQRAMQLLVDGVGRAESDADRRRWNHRTLISGVLVASLTLAAVVAWLTVARPDAWAQVVSAVEQRPWMRLTLQKSEVQLPEGEQFPRVVLWLDGKRQIAASDTPDGPQWIDLAKEESSRFDPTAGRVTVRRMKTVDGEMIQNLLAVVDRFDAGSKLSGAGRFRLTESRQSEVEIDGKMLDEFHFHFVNPESPLLSQEMTVRVDRKSKHPVQLSFTISGQDGAEVPSHVYAIDYPTTGPGDIYALGAPRDAPVDDLRSLAKFFPERRAKTPVDYEAVELMFPVGKELKWVSTAKRYRMHNGTATAEHADLLEVVDVSQKVYFAEGDTPTGNVPELSWWAKEISGVRFDESPVSQYNFPHDRCYSPYGSEDSYRSVHESKLPGLEGTIELRGPMRSVWLDPARDLIVRRWDFVNENGAVTVRQYDEVVQDSNGVWFVTKWRTGHVAERGAPLAGKVDGVATAVYLTEIQFQ